MKIVTIVGARPQFIKAAPVSRAIQKSNQGDARIQIAEVMVHTGQHYDDNLSQVFFDELEIRKPDYNLGVGSGSHGKMTGVMLARIEEVLLEEKPDSVLVYGDTNSTLAGALAAAKLHIPVAHVEAGLRSFNRQMPEEINRVLTDHVSTLLFCPTDTAVINLKKEGVSEGVFKVGDVMYDSVIYNIQLAEKRSQIIKKLKLEPKSYALATIHRAENTDSQDRLNSIFHAFERISSDELPFIIPLHPRTRKKIETFNLSFNSLQLIDPVSYLDMLLLEKQAKTILTDSGGVQKEAFWLGVPCVILRNETEWVELIDQGFNFVAGTNIEAIYNAFKKMINKKVVNDLHLYDKGDAGRKIIEVIMQCI